jgi:CRISPR system Cascade subunit CasC
MRLMFKDTLPSEELGARTKKIVAMVAEAIQEIKHVPNPEVLAQKVLEAAGLKIKSVDKGTDALFFMSKAQAKALAQLALDDTINKDKAKTALQQFPSVDVALFGRMVADDPSLNTDASSQVAHSISTHRVNNEYDYFTAVDDMAPEDNAGAGHIGTVEFNSSTLYRYGTVAVHELYKQLGSDTIHAVKAFIHAFVCSMPTGKQNTFANRTLPDAVLVTLRTDQPINLVGAFEKPVPAGDGGYVDESAKRLIAHANSVYDDFAGQPALSLAAGQSLSGLMEVKPLPKLLDALVEELSGRIENGRDGQ